MENAQTEYKNFYGVKSQTQNIDKNENLIRRNA